MRTTLPLLTGGLMAFCCASASAEGPAYIAGNLGLLLQQDSTNSGRFREDFAVPLADAVLTDGAAYVFDTGFEPGMFASLALGKTTPYGPFRSEFEVSYSRAGVKDHENFRALGLTLDEADAGILVGADTPTGTTIGAALGDTDGRISTYAIMINGFWDFAEAGTGVHPFIGMGIGAVAADVEYNPSGFELVNELAWSGGVQAMAGVNIDVAPGQLFHAGFRYRRAVPVEFDTSALFVSELEIDMVQSMAEIGWRVHF